LARSARLSETVRVHGNAQWTPEKLLAGCLLMSWHEGQTLTSRFEHARELLGTIFAGWRAPTSYTGYTTALAGKVGLLINRIRPVLQARVRRLAGHRWRIADWIVFAADGSRFESPRTKANEEGLGVRVKTAPLLRSFTPHCCIWERILFGISVVDREQTASVAIWKTWRRTSRREAS